MKKNVFCLLILFFVFVMCARAQGRYTKWVLNPVLGGIIVAKWKASNIVPHAGGRVSLFLQPEWGFGLNYFFADIACRDCYRYWQHDSRFPNDEFAYVVSRHTFMRRFNFFDLPIYYRLTSKQHNLVVGLGLSYRIDRRMDVEKELEWYKEQQIDLKVKTIGYCASLAYQFRVYRNFGLSADVVFRQSKDIPNTLSYGLGLTYSIFNKRREKKTE